MGAVHELLRRARSEAKPCLRLSAAQSRSTSHLGGLPELPIGAAWPIWKGAPLSFLAQIDLDAAPEFEWPDWAPREGRLLFFYEALEQPWGFDPKDRGCCAVIYVAPGVTCIERLPPESVPVEGRFRRKDLKFNAHVNYPSYERIGGYETKLNDNEFDEVSEELDALEPAEESGSGHLHRLFGWPSPVQNDTMELEAQFASNGLYCGTPEAYASLEAKALEPGASDWELLFQLDSDDDADMMWGDAGMLYFWIRRSDAAQRDFSNVWLVLQCC